MAATPARPLQKRGSPAPQGARRGLGLLISVLLLVAPLALLASYLLPRLQPDDQAVAGMVAANALYSGGQFELAARAYAQLGEQGFGGEALLHNHGLALLHAGRVDEAVAAWRHAQEQHPRSTAIRAALAEAEALQTSEASLAPAELAPLPPASGPLQEVRARWIARDEAAVLALLAWTVTAALLVVSIRSLRPSLRWLAGIASVPAAALVAFSLLLLLA